MDDLGIAQHGEGDNLGNGKSVRPNVDSCPQGSDRPWFNNDYYLVSASPIHASANLLEQLEAISRQQK